MTGITEGTTYLSVGSTGEAPGSDLAAGATRTVPDDGTSRLHGTKLWTGGAHVSHVATVLAGSDDLAGGARRAGLSKFVLDLGAPGVRLEHTPLLTSEHRFSAVHPDGATAELLAERGAR